jgi:hypothetical protein
MNDTDIKFQREDPKFQREVVEGVEQEENPSISQFKDHFPDSRSMGSRPLFWNLTSFPPLNLEMD